MDPRGKMRRHPVVHQDKLSPAKYREEVIRKVESLYRINKRGEGNERKDERE
jgi:hypothetical protein